MASSTSAKKQIIDSIKDVTNILVTVSKNPSVDELSAALGLTIFLNRLGKHATAVASGQMPRAIEFLEPDKTFEETADSLRDFIIALDKEKADHLRYKLDGDVVKIFITPFRTTISSDDLEFSQGDYNVEMVIGLNVVSEQDLDDALEAHGKILHDAVVATITSSGTVSKLGSIDWSSKNVSGVSEMAADLLGLLKTNKVSLDEQISTALLTGIVAATERFSNNKTSSRVMTMAAELMASGANQQLIVSKLEGASREDGVDYVPSPPKMKPDGSIVLKANSSTKLEASDDMSDEPQEDDHFMEVDHNDGGDMLDQTARRVAREAQQRAATEAKEQLSDLAEDESPEDDLVVTLKPEPKPEKSKIEPSVGEITSRPTSPGSSMGEPLIGGTLNATTDQAAADKRRELEKDRNRTILTHGRPASESMPPPGDGVPSFISSPLNASMAPAEDQSMVNAFSSGPELPPVVNSITQSRQGQLLSEAQSVAQSSQGSAMQAVDAAFAAPQPPQSSIDRTIPTTGMPTSPTIADLEAQSAAPVGGPEGGFADQSSVMPPPQSSMPPMPDFSNLPPLPPAPDGAQLDSLPSLGIAPLPPQPPAQVAGDQGSSPAKFQIPGQ